MAGQKSGRNPQGRTAPTTGTETPARKVGVSTVDPDVFAGLTVTAESAPLPKATRDTGPNPFAEAVANSYGADAPAFGASVPQDAVKRAVYLIRKASRDLNYGVRIIEDEPDANGLVRLRFKAKAKKQSKPKDAAAS